MEKCKHIIESNSLYSIKVFIGKRIVYFLIDKNNRLNSFHLLIVKNSLFINC